MNQKDCPFRNINREIILESCLCPAIYDQNPVNKGHISVIPKRHVNDYFGLSQDEIESIREVVEKVKEFLVSKEYPSGYNIGFNVGRDAGQTIDHAHIHFIPRYKVGMEDPTGGVRHVITEKGKY